MGGLPVNLTDLLDELRSGILNDRSDRENDGSDSDYLWTDATLIRYINEAQRRFAVRSLCIVDSRTTEVCDVTLHEGVTEYDLHPSILCVVTAKLEDATTDLIRVGHSVLNQYVAPNNMIWDASQFSQLPPGSPKAFATDESIGEDDEASFSAVTMRVFPAPSADEEGVIVKMRVIRKPLEDLTGDNMGAVPEVPVDHHFEMLDWAAYLALRIVDHDAGDPKRAGEFAASFESHVNEARKMVLRKMFAPRPWGFGRGGFIWEH